MKTEIITARIEHIIQNETALSDFEKTTLRKALEELKYREVRLVTTAMHMDSRDYVYGVCPTCGSILEREYMSSCDVCGQKLKWKLSAMKVHDNFDFQKS